MKPISKYIAKELNSNNQIDYNKTENETWEFLLKRQMEVVKDRACDEFIQGLEELNFPKTRIPQHTDVSEVLFKKTGWKVKPVPALIPAEDFFQLLANKEFPAATFIRSPEEIDYLQEPDIFHEYFGHAPLLCHQGYADFMENFGKMALTVSGKERLILFRIFWFTIEFGLVKSSKGTRIYGGGILSSPKETISSLEDKKVERVNFDIINCLRTPFRIDIVQPLYFIIESLDDLLGIDPLFILEQLKNAQALGDFEALFEKKTKVAV